MNGCGARLAPGQHWERCGETDMGQTAPVLCEACGGKLVRAEKGGKGSACNRTACESGPADWYNQYTQRWYCEACAKRINAAATHSICDRR